MNGIEFISGLLMMYALYYNYTGSVIAIASDTLSTERKATKRKFWVNPLNTEKRRREQGDHWNLIPEMRRYDEPRFGEHLRMTPQIYDKLFCLVAPLITKNSEYRQPIDPGTRLEVTLRYLATGDSCTSLANQFRLGRTTVPKIINETLPAIIKVLEDKVLLQPSRDDLQDIAEGFWRRWNFPNCVGAIDGKHIAIIAPPNCGSEYFNYKNYNSIVLMAVCDYRYRFTMIDVGMPGRSSDGGVFRDTNIGRQFEENWIHLPEPARIGGDGPKLPYYLIGDEGFGLKKYLQRPYPGKKTGNLQESKRIYNYRLSRARRIIENSFGILASKWRIFRKPIDAGVDKVKAITVAAICLHNFILMEESDLKPHQRTYLTQSMVDRVDNGHPVPGDWRNDHDQIHFNTFSDLQEEEFDEFDLQDEFDSGLDLQDEDELSLTNPVQIRNALKEFFMMSGLVNWQFNRNDF